MLYAMKENRQSKITKEEKQKFIDAGYKIAELVEGKLVFEEVETKETLEIKALEAKNEGLEAENEALKAELEALKVPKQGKTKEEGK